MIFMVVITVFMFVATMVVVVIVMFVDESFTSALVDVEVLMLMLGLLSNSNCCYTDYTADGTEPHPF